MEKSRLEKELEEIQTRRGGPNWLVVLLLLCLLVVAVYAIYMKTTLDRVVRERDTLLLERETLQKELDSTVEELRELKTEISGQGRENERSQ